MPRSGKEARLRLQQAAVELCQERGYEQTTAAEIAARAGVTERTFFRHFADKREVFFGGEAPLREALVQAIATAPEELGPLPTLLLALRSVEPMLEANRPLSEPRRELLLKTPALQERELTKVGALTEALAAALRQRGVGERVAMLTAQSAIALSIYAGNAWLDDPSKSLGFYLTRALEELHALTRVEPSGSG